jgi:hypothetical protein
MYPLIPAQGQQTQSTPETSLPMGLARESAYNLWMGRFKMIFLANAIKKKTSLDTYYSKHSNINSRPQDYK